MKARPWKVVKLPKADVTLFVKRVADLIKFTGVRRTSIEGGAMGKQIIEKFYISMPDGPGRKRYGWYIPEMQETHLPTEQHRLVVQAYKQEGIGKAEACASELGGHCWLINETTFGEAIKEMEWTIQKLGEHRAYKKWWIEGESFKSVTGLGYITMDKSSNCVLVYLGDKRGFFFLKELGLPEYTADTSIYSGW